jgi:hypothetical protein
MHEPDDFLRRLFAIADMRGRDEPPLVDEPEQQTSAPAPEPVTAPVSLMITRRQRAQLKDLGFSDEAVSEMTPSEAHRHLGL